MKGKIGVAFLLAFGVVSFAVATQQTTLTDLLSALAVLGLAAGALLSGTAGETGRSV